MSTSAPRWDRSAGDEPAARDRSVRETATRTARAPPRASNRGGRRRARAARDQSRQASWPHHGEWQTQKQAGGSIPAAQDFLSLSGGADDSRNRFILPRAPGPTLWDKICRRGASGQLRRFMPPSTCRSAIVTVFASYVIYFTRPRDEV